MTKNTERAIFIATLNAVMHFLGYVEGTRHCRDEGPEICAADIAHFLAHYFRGSNVALIGLQPAILEALVQQFGASHVRATDRNPKNVGTVRWRAIIQDGDTMNDTILDEADVWLVTGTTLVNSTFDMIYQKSLGTGKPCFFFGVTLE